MDYLKVIKVLRFAIELGETYTKELLLLKRKLNCETVTIQEQKELTIEIAKYEGRLIALTDYIEIIKTKTK